jgi:8-oxo-dGTP pyrophosphatase MutT (NUDIX family)
LIFYTKPHGFIIQRAINVALCFVAAEGQVLLLQRAANAADRHSGRWGMPGGTVEECEPLDAVWRELYEETGIWINKRDLRQLHTLFVADGTHDFVFTLFRLDLTHQPPVTIKKDEHSDYCWVAPNLGMPLVRGQDEFIRLCCPELSGTVQSGVIKESAA